MSASTTVSLTQLQHALARVLETLADRRGDVVELDADYYWALAGPARYKLAQPPATDDFTVGQLTDGLDSVPEVLNASPENIHPLA